MERPVLYQEHAHTGVDSPPCFPSMRPSEGLSSLIAPVSEPESPPVAWTDFERLCGPHVQPVREVLEGRRSRYKLSFEQATLVFHSGCVLTRVYYEGKEYALPAFLRDDAGRPLLLTNIAAPSFDSAGSMALAKPVTDWLADFSSLPKSLRLFCFTLLREVFDSCPLAVRSHCGNDVAPEESGLLISACSIAPWPTALRSLLADVAWPLQTL